MQFLKILCAATVAAASASAGADEGPSANLNLVSQYRFRGVDQTWGRPAVQGGADWAGPQGLYAGAWFSNVDRRSYPGGGLELDLYAGINQALDSDWSVTAGVYAYLYPGADTRHARCPSAAYAAPCALPSQRFDTAELNAGFSWRWLSYKLSVAASDYFGANASTGYDGRTRGTLYHDLGATLPLAEGYSLALHLGRTDVRGRYGAHSADYTDLRLALSRSFEAGWSVTAALVAADNDAFFRPPVGGLSATSGDTRALNKPAVVLQLGRSF